MLVLEPDDWQLWRRLRLAALAEAPRAFGATLAEWQGAGDREERWRGRLAIPDSRNLVAVVEGEPLGMASGVPAEAPGAVELISMWVGPEARGLGVGALLIAEVEEWARGAGATTLKLSVRPDNAAALALYTRCGFGHTAEPGELLPDGSRELVMAKPLGVG
ncbi:putative acetyltransferase [Streptomyces albus]|uniref:Putative acetyltransferase n=1 Tax=Streptomyces albus (strain ATCC 21838 / DSM 41398 / FERM P-419 / JCM 4703 / NBRC 107858) TaxID=1081613 RepID=A0A0B5EHV7_STRA4|nr:putative acetyltransferase [Streptomyces albus]AOU75301.1 putative acetyltransferase [Streptomyces albus]